MVLIALFIGKVVISSLQNSNILGTTTYLAKGDDSDSSGSGSSGSGSSGSNSSDSSDSDDDDSGSGSSTSGSSNSSSGLSGSSESSGSTNTTVTPVLRRFNPTRFPTQTEVEDEDEEEDNEDEETGVGTQTEIRQDESRTEVRLSEEERIRVRTKDGRTRIDITSGGIKTRLEYRDDRIVVKAQQEDGTEIELEDDTLFKIEQRLGASGIKVATAGAESFVIQKGSTGAVTDFPVSIDLATNTLTVNTPSGVRTVAVLPDQAVQNLISANIVNRLGAQAVLDEVQNNNLSSISQLVALGTKNNIPVYEINGLSDQRFLGFIPVAIEKTITVSAETGAIVLTQESFSNRVLDLFAF